MFLFKSNSNFFRSDVALIYNDRAVLENHHVSAAFRLMRIDDYNILSEFTSDEYKYVYRSFRKGEFYCLIKKFSAFGNRNGFGDRYEFTFYTIKNNEESFKYAREVSE
jgi:hypothetical protein